ncbi:MAG TPA: hypothetical protein VG755_34555 [Nannocystaceae bacterium]|nr:hypothetical protein [Nannocystaceae bacterium]
MFRPVLVGIAFVLACGQAAAPAEQGGAESQPDAKAAVVAEDCNEQHASELRTLLEASCSAPSLVDTKKLALASWPGDATVGDAIPIEISAAGAGGLLEPPQRSDELATWLHEQVASSKVLSDAKGEPWHGSVALYIHADAPLAQVDAVVRVIVAEKIDKGWLVFGSGTRRTAKPRYPELQAKFQAELDAVEPRMRAMELAKRLRPLADRCKDISAAFGEVATGDAAGRCITLARGLASAVVSCGCPDYEPELIAWVQLLGGPADTPDQQSQRVAFTAEDPIRSSANTRWGELVATRKDGFTALSFALDAGA